MLNNNLRVKESEKQEEEEAAAPTTEEEEEEEEDADDEIPLHRGELRDTNKRFKLLCVVRMHCRKPIVKYHQK